jgi:NADH-quinone oxidoreductase subunit H
MFANINEIRKFGQISFVWLLLIFGAVWMASWAVGVALPMILLNADQGPQTQMIAEICKALVPIVAVMVFIPTNATYMVLCERRALALFTQRRGPCRVGPDGFWQTGADAIKLLLKESITPTGADALMFTLAPIIFFAPSIFGAIPLLAAVTNNNELFQVTNLPTGIFFVLAASAVPVVGIVMGGWASNNKYSLVGGLRSAAQAISYEIPLVLSLVTICMLAQTLDVVKIANQQQGGFLNWNVFGGGALSGVDKFLATAATASGGDLGEAYKNFAAAYPDGAWSYLAAFVLVVCCILLCGIYMTGACAEINRIPFDLPEAESELVSGYNTEYSGIKFAIFFLAEFTNLFIVSSIAVVMFFGGGDNPIPAWILQTFWPGFSKFVVDLFTQTPGLSGLTNTIVGLHLIDPDTFFAAIWVIIKVYTIVLFAILVRGTLPRFRVDQLMDFGWKRLVPLTLILFLLVVFAREAVICHG